MATTAPSKAVAPAGALRGFTLIELMVAVAILAILAAVAAPSFNGVLLSNKLTGFANAFIGSAQLARGEAIKRNAVVRICRSADGASCAASGTWQQGWIVFHDPNDNGTVDADETVIKVQQALPSDYHFTGDSYSVGFAPTGGIAALVTLSLCRAAPSAGNQERTLKLSGTGRTSAETTHTGSCP